MEACQLSKDIQALIAVQACPRLYCKGFPNLTLLLLQVRAGEGQSEADGYVFTNPVYKTSMYSGLTPKARQQVVSETVPRLRALGACTEACFVFSPPESQNHTLFSPFQQGLRPFAIYLSESSGIISLANFHKPKILAV